MATMRARFRTQCWFEVDDARQLGEAELIERIPFAPRAGDHLKVTSRGDYYEVSEVRWDVDAPTYLIVYFREPSEGIDALPEFANLRAEGWNPL